MELPQDYLADALGEVDKQSDALLEVIDTGFAELEETTQSEDSYERVEKLEAVQSDIRRAAGAVSKTVQNQLRALRQRNNMSESHRFDGSRYNLMTRLGAGAFGVVYRAVDRQEGQEVALKFFVGDVDVDLLDIEVSMAQRARSPNVARYIALYDLRGMQLRLADTQQEASAVIVMELVPGSELADLDPVLSAMSPDARREAVMQLAGGLVIALAEIHEHCVAHRDIKPGNVMVQTVAGTMRPVVIDFGLSCLACTSSHACKDACEAPRDNDISCDPAVSAGTPEFFSPEKIKAVYDSDPFEADLPDDMWALGNILWRLNHTCLAEGEGAPPEAFRQIVETGVDHQSSMDTVFHSAADSPATVPGLDEIVNRLLLVPQSQRATAASFLQAFSTLPLEEEHSTGKRRFQEA